MLLSSDRYVNTDYSQWTMSIILLLTVGGTPLEAMQRYAPMWSRFTLVMFNVDPLTLDTAVVHY